MKNVSLHLLVGRCARGVALLVCLGCSHQDASVDTGSASLKSAIVSANTKDTTRPPGTIVPPACDFVSSGGNPCPGLLDKVIPTTAELDAADAGYLTPAQGTPRKKKQYAITYVNSGARHIDLAKLGETQSIIMGAIDYLKGKPDDDDYYGVGKNLQQRVYIVARKAGALTTSPTYGTVVGTWDLFARQDGSVVKVGKQLNSQKVIQCTKDSYENGDHTKPNAFFVSCANVKTVEESAANNHVSFEAALAFLACHPGKDGKCTGANAGTTDTASVRLSSVLGHDFEKLFGAPDVSPFWFTCGLGCCTTEM